MARVVSFSPARAPGLGRNLQYLYFLKVKYFAILDSIAFVA